MPPSAAIVFDADDAALLDDTLDTSADAGWGLGSIAKGIAGAAKSVANVAAAPVAATVAVAQGKNVGQALANSVKPIGQLAAQVAPAAMSFAMGATPAGILATQIAKGLPGMKGIADYAEAPTRWGAETVKAVANAGYAVASGESLKSAAQKLQRGVANITTDPSWKIMQTGAAVIPGVGAPVSAGMAAAAAIGRGESVRDVALSAARNAAPGGPVAKAAFDVAIGIAKGQQLTEAARVAARNALPGGAPARFAFDLGVAAAKRQNLGKAALMSGTRALSSANPLAALATRAADVSLLSPAVQVAARAVLANPALRSLPIDTVAARLRIPVATARDAVASIAQAANRVGSGAPTLAPAHDISRALTPGMSLDQAMARHGSRVAPPIKIPGRAPRTPIRIPGRRVMVPGRSGAGVRWRALSSTAVARLLAAVPAARRLAPAVLRSLSMTSALRDASGVDPSGTKYIVESGDFMTKIATKVVGDSSRWKELRDANPSVSPDKIFPGQILNLPASWQKAPSPPVGGSPPAVPPGVTPPTVSGGKYTVKAGDTMTGIATKLVGNSARWVELRAANPQVSDPNKIFVGQVLNLPPGWPSTPGGTASPPVATPPAVNVPPGVIPFPPGGGGTTSTPPKSPPLGDVPITPTGFAPPGGIAQVQLMLANWNGRERVAGNFGAVVTDFSGQLDARTKAAIGAFQLWANQTRSAGLRTDGFLDNATYAALLAYTTAAITQAPPTGLPPIAGGVPPLTPPMLPPGGSPPFQVPPGGSTPPIPPFPPVPGTTDPGTGGGGTTTKKSDGGGALLALAAAAAAFLS
jgi:nucleoid-associated protein YgaU